jgi:hypothetical protein
VKDRTCERTFSFGIISDRARSSSFMIKEWWSFTTRKDVSIFFPAETENQHRLSASKVMEAKELQHHQDPDFGRESKNFEANLLSGTKPDCTAQERATSQLRLCARSPHSEKGSLPVLPTFLFEL